MKTPLKWEVLLKAILNMKYIIVPIQLYSIY